MPKISIIVPVYNVEPYLVRCLDSLVKQTLDDIEILVINDSTPDRSQDIIDRYKQRYPDKIKSYIKPNGGISSVRNFGIDHAQGEYIGFVDGDDYVEPDMYEKLYHAAKSSDANIAVCDFFFTYENKEECYHEFNYHNTHEMMTRLYAVLWNKIYKASFLKKVNIRFIEGYRFEDASYLLRLAPYCEKFTYVREPLVHYVQRPTSITSSHNSKVKDVVFVLNDLFAFYRERGFLDTYRAELEYVFVKFTLGQPFRSCSKIKDNRDRKQSLQMLWSTLNDHFPTWRHNHYLRDFPGLKHRYFRLVNKPLFWISARIFYFL